MAKYFLQRVIYMIITIFLIASITFFLMKLMPGTPFSAQAKLSPDQIHIMNEKYGLNEPVPVQYAHYMLNLLKGDLGTSFQFDNRDVSTLIAERIGPSVTLGIEALVFGTIVGILLGVLAALKQNTWLDYGSTFIAVLG